MIIKSFKALALSAVLGTLTAVPASAIELWVFVPGGQFSAYSTETECSARYSNCVQMLTSCGGYPVFLNDKDFDEVSSAFDRGARTNVVRVSNNKNLCHLQNS